MEYVYKHMDWSNVEVLGRNRLPVRPFYCGYPNKESARQGRREECSNYRLLNGQWKFAYYESPFYVPDTCMEKAYDDREFGMMPVPGHWQLNGYDYPHYNDAIALFPILMIRVYRQTIPRVFTGTHFRRRNKKTGNIS